MLLDAEDSFLEVAHLIRILENQMGLAFSTSHDTGHPHCHSYAISDLSCLYFERVNSFQIWYTGTC